MMNRDWMRGTLRVWVSVAILLFILAMVCLGQWDLAFAGFIGLIVANGLKALLGLR